MLFAEDKNGNRVCADDAVKGEQYFCPICHSEVILKAGDINQHHFAHVSDYACDDMWDYDMSEWHRKMQSYFPIEDQEIIIEYNGAKHRADICIDNVVIEFQHSQITAAEFKERNDFYLNAGYKLAWVFDFRDYFDLDQIIIQENDNAEYYRWKYPMRIFKLAPTISDCSPNFTIWISGCSIDDYYIKKVIWTAKDEVGDISFSRFILSEDYDIDLRRITNARCLFYSKDDWFNIALDAFKQNYKSEFSIKVKGVKGHPQGAYTCPRTGIFGLMSKDNKCEYCKYCALISHKKRAGENSYNIYCCYPNVVRTQPGVGGSECCRCDTYEI